MRQINPLSTANRDDENTLSTKTTLISRTRSLPYRSVVTSKSLCSYNSALQQISLITFQVFNHERLKQSHLDDLMVAFIPETHAYFDVCFPVLITTFPKENVQLIKKSSVQLTCALRILGIHLWRNKD